MRATRPLIAFLLIASAAAAQPAQQPYPQDQPGPGPYAQPSSAQPSYAEPPEQQGGPPPGASARGGRGMKAMQKFEAANTTHDGKLTLQQAQAANLRPLVKNFAAIDREHKGYVTVQDIREWRQARRAAMQQQQQQQAQPPAPPQQQ